MRFLVRNITKGSLVRRAMWGWAGIIVLVLISMAASLIIIQSTEGDAERINVAGSLRMQSYRISQVVLRVNHGLQKTESSLEKELNEFDRRVETPILAELLDLPPSNLERQSLESVLREWSELKTRLRVHAEDDELPLLAEIDRFASGIDKMVGLFQAHTDLKIEQLRYIHGVSISLVIVIAFLALLDLFRTVVIPLRELVNAADKAKHGDLSARVDYLKNDELGLLGNTFNHMASSLEVTYLELEERVARKTHELRAQTESLELLYETSRLINDGVTHASAMRSILNNLKRTLGGGDFELHLTPQALAYVDPSENFGRIENDDAEPPVSGAVERWFSISDKKHNYGRLLWRAESPKIIEEQEQLIVAVCDLVASAFSRDWKNEQTWRLLLVEERATIARELHDSLAQALSYLKMQVSRWQTLSERNADKQQLADITAEIRTGLNAAYGQLRELLTTFRLKLDEPGLESALKATVAEYRERGSMEIVLDYRLGEMALRPNAEIHLLQIVREALSNVVRHAKATRADILFNIGHDNKLIVEVSDNGVGLNKESAGPMHHGVSIMNERTQSLDAELAINNNSEGGVTVRIDCDMDKIKRTGETTIHDK
ncbi:type IV pili methyl-accepting chemotaxis transducer N-terminal domain-containing protein [Alkalimarinus coralli]|uniref:type IV pili methyl-accepting chemotaxis transducer N-terminal domain-containing protein n=1 Tax=Alkalimarinus coralli TaxID=2935863 RepID=UPI00202AF642|nr:type IV pili methyl-accepting chemotaxis transducer N-terminal domain-containing protein [Alkalimarinus coralli]